MKLRALDRVQLVVIAYQAGQAYTPGTADVGHQLTCTTTVTYALLAVTVSTGASPRPATARATVAAPG